MKMLKIKRTLSASSACVHLGLTTIRLQEQKVRFATFARSDECKGREKTNAVLSHVLYLKIKIKTTCSLGVIIESLDNAVSTRYVNDSISFVTMSEE